MKEHCCDEHSHGYIGTKMLILGALVIANDQLQFMSWWSFLGAVLLLKGLFVLVMHKHGKK